MKCNTKTLVLTVLVVLIITVTISLVKMTMREKFQVNPDSMEGVLELLEKATQYDVKNSFVSNQHNDISKTLDFIEKHIYILKKNETSPKVKAAADAKNSEHLILKCSPNSTVANFENAPDVQSQADSNRQILQEIYQELSGLS